MTAIPWFKFYAADYLTDRDVDNLPLEAQGILVRMWSVLCLEGSLPGDVEEIARKCKVRSKTMHMHADKLMQFFVRQQDGTYNSDRMETERQRSGIISKKRSDAANTRWDKERNAIASANGNPKGHSKNLASRDAVRSQSQSQSQNQSQKTESKPLPPTPLDGGNSILQKVKQKLKDDLSTAFVNIKPFEDDAYDKYFRDAVLVKIVDRTVFLHHPLPEILREGVQKFRKRLVEAFRASGFCEAEFEIVEDDDVA